MKKKLLGWLVLVLCLLAGSALAADFGVVYRTDALNLRGQCSSSSEWLGSYPRGTWVEITGSQNNFYRVRTPDGRTGYMSKNYIDTVGSEDQDWMVEVNNANGGAFLNFRAQPSFNAQVLDIFYNGVPLRASALNNGWFTVELNGQTGYVRSEYLLYDCRWYTAVSATPVYAYPSPDAPRVALLDKNSAYPIIAEYNGYLVISLRGASGFVLP